MTQSVFIGTGTTLTFATSAFAAEITGINASGVSRAVIETSHLGTPAAAANEIGSKTFLAGKLVDPGELAVEGHLDADTIPPIEADPEQITVAFPLASGEASASSWEFPGQMVGYDWGIVLEEKATFSATIKAVGPIVVTAAVDS